MRLIDADALIADLEYDVDLDAGMLDDMDFFSNERDLVQFDKDCKQNAIDILRHTPTIEPERKKGKWIHDGYDIPHGIDWMHCSVCGRREPNVPAARTPYCPTCGFRMEEGGE